jgi:uncharacterized protein (DUF1778 family)
MKAPKRDERFHVLLSRQERQMLDDLANREGVKSAVMVRMLVRAAHKTIKSARR